MNRKYAVSVSKVRTMGVAVLALLLPSVCPAAGAPADPTACSRNPGIVAACYSLRGRLSSWNDPRACTSGSEVVSILPRIAFATS